MHKMDEQDLFECSQCEMLFPSLDFLVDHNVEEHTHFDSKGNVIARDMTTVNGVNINIEASPSSPDTDREHDTVIVDEEVSTESESILVSIPGAIRNTSSMYECIVSKTHTQTLCSDKKKNNDLSMGHRPCDGIKGAILDLRMILHEGGMNVTMFGNAEILQHAAKQ